MYIKQKSSWLKHMDFIVADLLILEISFALAYMIRHLGENPVRNPIYLHMMVILAVISLLVGFFNQSYKNVIRRGYFQEFKQTCIHISVVILIAMLYMFSVRISDELSRTVFFITWGLGSVLLLSVRCIIKSLVKKQLLLVKDKRSVLLVTTKEDVEQTIKDMGDISYQDYRITGIILINDEEHRMQEVAEVPVIPKDNYVLDYMNYNVVDEVFFRVRGEYEIPQDLLKGCEEMGITIHIGMMHNRVHNTEQIVEKFANYPVLTTSFRLATERQVFFKRALDIVSGILGLMATGILVLFVAPIIKIQSPGPIFFSQMRVGVNGRRFKIYKFRSMYMDAEERKKELMDQNEMNGLMFKMKDDPRIFPFGKFIRKTSIDEFPQFLNVLKGEMSLIGTRPPTESEFQMYSPRHKKRLMMKPGITGLWQVSGRSDITEFEDVIKLDTEYIAKWNIGMDLRIIFQTIYVVFGGKGSV